MRNGISLGLVMILSTTVLTVRAAEPQRFAPAVDQKQMQFHEAPVSTTKSPAPLKPLVNQDNKVIGVTALEPAKTMAKRMLETKEERPRVFTAKAKIWRVIPESKSQQPKIEMISRPTVAAIENEKCSIQIGQNVFSKLSTSKQKGSTDVLTRGNLIEITVSSLGAEKVSVRTKLVTTEVTTNEPTHVETTTKTKEAVTEAKLKEPVRFQLGSGNASEPQTWCEMIVDEVVQ